MNHWRLTLGQEVSYDLIHALPFHGNLFVWSVGRSQTFNVANNKFGCLHYEDFESEVPCFAFYEKKKGGGVETGEGENERHSKREYVRKRKIEGEI